MRIALLQAAPCHDLVASLTVLDQHLRAAKAQGAALLIAPEMWLGGYNIPPENIARNSGQFDGLMVQIEAVVARHGVALVIGCAAPARPKPYNMALAFDGAGTLVAYYAKCHLYGALDAGRFTQGECLSSVFSLAGMQVGLAICYDIEFPETARTLALNGAQLIAVPTANMTPYESVNHRLIPARAEENGIFIAYTNLCGSEGALTYCGLSCVCDPNGNTVAQAGPNSELLIADIDPAEVARTQAARPFLADRRADLYFKKDTSC